MATEKYENLGLDLPDKGAACTNCNTTGNLHYEPELGGSVCEACGFVMETNQLRQEIEPDEKRAGEYGKGDDRAKHHRHLGNVGNVNKVKILRKLTSITAVLRLPPSLTKQISTMLDSYTDGKYGHGRWMELVVASCVYAICRMNNKPLTLIDVADAIQCNVFKLGKVFSRLADQLQLQLDPVDPSLFVDRILAGLSLPKYPGLTQQQIEDKNKALLTGVRAQALQLLELGKKDWLTAGRIPSAITAAAIIIALRAHGVEYPVNDVATNLHIAARTIRCREREFNKSLIRLSQRLPWGKNITEKSINFHLRYIMDNMSMLLELDEIGKKDRKELLKPPAPTAAIAGAPTSSKSKAAKAAATTASASSSSSALVPTSSNPFLSLSSSSSSSSSSSNNLPSHPPSFLRSLQNRTARLMRLKKAITRLQHHSKSAFHVDLKGLGVDLATVPDSSDTQLDDEDLLIEKLLLKGVPAALIVDGSFNARQDADAVRNQLLAQSRTSYDAAGVENLDESNLDDMEEFDEELDKYVRTDAEIELMNRLKSDQEEESEEDDGGHPKGAKRHQRAPKSTLLSSASLLPSTSSAAAAAAGGVVGVPPPPPLPAGGVPGFMIPMAVPVVDAHKAPDLSLPSASASASATAAAVAAPSHKPPRTTRAGAKRKQ